MGFGSSLKKRIGGVAKNPLKVMPAVRNLPFIGGAGLLGLGATKSPQQLMNMRYPKGFGSPAGIYTGMLQGGGVGSIPILGDLLGGGAQAGGAGPFAGPMPERPPFESLIDPNTGLLKSQYQIQGDINTQGMEALRGEALRTGPSAWRTLTEQQEADKLAAQQGTALTQAKNQLAATRGLSTGAAERMMGRGQVEGLRERQALGGRMALADEAKRMDTLRALPGQELGLAQFKRGTEEANIRGAMGDIEARRNADMDAYLERMKGWASERTAAATPSGGKK